MKEVTVSYWGKKNIKADYMNLYFPEQEDTSDIILVKGSELPDSDTFVIEDDNTGAIFKRMIIPEGYFVFKRM